MPVLPKQIRCRFHPKCRIPDCVYSHDSKSLPSDLCRYYLVGKCFFGDKCRFKHPESLEEVIQSNTDSSQCPTCPLMSHIRRNFWDPAPSCAPVAVTDRETEVSHPVTDGAAVQLGEKPPLCPFTKISVCTMLECTARHWNVCDFCNCQSLDPEDVEQREQHTKECQAKFEKDLHYSFAVQQSVDKTCDICQDVVLKQPDVNRRRFGLLSDCNHCFCFDCVMKWRSLANTEGGVSTQVRRTCPMCRVPSYFVLPSSLWPETAEEKERIFAEVKSSLATKHCKHYQRGTGSCPFGSECWYLHMDANGTVVQLRKPKSKKKAKRKPPTTTAWLMAEEMGDQQLMDYVNLILNSTMAFPTMHFA